MPVATSRMSGDRVVVPPENLENAGKDIDEYLASDRRYPELADQIGVFSQANVGLSGVNDFDYPAISSISEGLANVPLISTVKHVPLPSELVEQFSYMQCNCQMGLFPEIRRAWLSIDSDIFVWNYEDGSDLAYFDGLSETILSAGLVKPKPGIFQEHIKFLLCLTTPVDVVLLGVSFSENADSGSDEEYHEMHLLPEPLFTLQTDNVYMSGITGTFEGRIFLCGRDGCLYEMDYQGAGNWFGKKCKKINHSASSLSFLVPSFLSFSFSGEDPVVQLAVDNTRNILYCRTERGSIQVFDLGKDGTKTSYVTCCYEDNIVNKAASMLSIDRTRLKPIVHIAPISTNESQLVHLVAITQSGVRLYFMTTTAERFEERPSKLSLVHVRMPPGCAPSARLERPFMVHAAYYRQGIALLCSSPNEENDVLWSISPEIFPFQKNLQESSVNTPLEGRAWALHEVPEAMYPMLPSPVPMKWPDPPTVVTQHALPSRKFVVLSAQGSYLFTTIRPFEQLKHLLLDNNGPDSEAVQGFFRLLQVDHACATALVLACSTTDLEIADWATQAFFRYGGATVSYPVMTLENPAEKRGQPLRRQYPSQAHETGMSPDMSYIPPTPVPGRSHGGSYLATPATRQPATPVQNPQLQSTPYASTVGSGVVQPEALKSGRIAGLYLHIARILGPLWDERLVIQEDRVLPEPPNNWIYSRLTSDQIGWFVEQLQKLEKWLDANMTHFAGVRSPLGSHVQRRVGTPLQTSQLGPGNTEADTVNTLRHLIRRSREVLSLWQILDDNEFHLVVQRLSQESRDRLNFLKFRDFVLSGNVVCNQLIASLITCFLDDNATTDIISTQLRDLCPTIYTTDDAVCTKANELLDTAKKATDKYEKERTLQEATRLYRQVANQIDLAYICGQFEELRFFDGIVELAVLTASTIDPQNLALHYYESGQPEQPGPPYDAFLKRQRCYNCVLDTLTHLLTTRQSRANAPNVPSRPGPPIPPDGNALTSEEAERYLEGTLVMALRSRDELFLSSVFDWLIEKSMTERLLEVRSEFLETYLKRLAAIQHPNNIPVLDLLWKYYEKTENYSGAARILCKLAEREGSDINLEGRLEYLSRAIMSAKSCNVRPSSISDGEFLHELEEKLEVARLQLQVHEELVQLKDTGRYPNVNDALDELNSKLMDVTKLYGDFADRFRLSECKLAIIHCAGHFDAVLVEDLWNDIIDSELNRTRHSSPDDRMTALRYKFVVLGKTYVHSERYFPLSFLVRVLEQHCCRLNWESVWVFETLLEIGVALPVLHRIYDRLFKAKDQIWQTLSQPFHVLEVLYNLIFKFVETPTLVSPQDRPTFTATVYDACATYLVELQSISSRHPTCQELIGLYKSLQSRLKRAL
ncbi:nuclear pore complex protein Nup155-like isoform X2 [Dendronephthya gigantea]|uniref:nuclear pore complex protein Nup155-like isoform X2 n=1 Tax=Dendronephthya gigantea TaxID=151771 RepID=UPI001068D4A1|nr:nuclear pore complex protein Nup155-like isoform X2 [Dendronephthya gigantea]